VSRRIAIGHAILVYLCACVGCESGNLGLHETLRDFRFTALTPPSTLWAPGSIVQIDRRMPDAPALRSTPAMAGAPIDVVPGEVPDVSRNHEERLDINLGVSLPQQIKAKLDTNNARQYSVISTGNRVERVPLDPYTVSTFPTMRDRFGQQWLESMGRGAEIYYIYELWSATGLEYQFYNDSGVKVSAGIPLSGGATVDLGGGWSAKSDGTLTYSGSPLYLGYKANPVIVVDGQAGPGAVTTAVTRPTTRNLSAERAQAVTRALDRP
jgi:hypothetical protein